MSDKLVLHQEIMGHITPVVSQGFNTERFTKMAVMALAENPSLKNATKVSLFKELVKCARMGLVPDGHEAALVPFKSEAKLMPMTGGLIKLARKSGEIKTLTACLVYQHDNFRVWNDQNGQNFEHHSMTFGDKGPLIGCYAVAWLVNGGMEFEAMDMEELRKIENVSRAKNSPWKGPFKTEMMKKSVMRRLLKRLPRVSHMDEALRVDNELYDLGKNVEVSPTSTRLREAVLDTPDMAEPIVENQAEGGG